MMVVERLAMRLYLIAPVEVYAIVLPGVPPRRTIKMWDECSADEREPWLRLAAEFLADARAALCEEVREFGT